MEIPSDDVTAWDRVFNLVVTITIMVNLCLNMCVSRLCCLSPFDAKRDPNCKRLRLPPLLLLPRSLRTTPLELCLNALKVDPRNLLLLEVRMVHQLCKLISVSSRLLPS